jgi:hypothetical protein
MAIYIEDDSFFPHAEHYQNYYPMDNGVMPQNPYAFAQMQQQIRPQDPSAKMMTGSHSKGMMMDGMWLFLFIHAIIGWVIWVSVIHRTVPCHDA